MKITALVAVLAFVLIGSVGCTSEVSGPYGDPGIGNVTVDGSGMGLHPVSGTDEGLEMFKDEGSD